MVAALLALLAILPLAHGASLRGSPVPIPEEIQAGLVGKVAPHDNYTIYNLSLPTPYGSVAFICAVPKLFKPTKVATILIGDPYPWALMAAYIPQWSTQLNFTHPAILIYSFTGTQLSQGTYDSGSSVPTQVEIIEQWLQEQSWSNGVVLIEGASAMGIASFFTLRANLSRSARRFQVMQISTPDGYRSLYQGGAYLNFTAYAVYGYINQTVFYEKTLHHESRLDPFWSNLTTSQYLKTIEWVTLQMSGWMDIFQAAHIDAMHEIYAQSDPSVRNLHRFFINPLGHCSTPLVPLNQTALGNVYLAYYISLGVAQNIFGSLATTALAKKLQLLQWEAYLAVSTIPRLVWYVNGNSLPNSKGHFSAGADQWPATQAVPLYLQHGGYLTMNASTTTNVTTYTYDPANPYPTIGGCNFPPSEFKGSPFADIAPECGYGDQYPAASRPDVLHYDTGALTTEVFIMGRVTATLYVSSSAVDTDFIATLVDVYPNNSRILIQQGVIRMRWREDKLEPSLLTPGVVYKVTLDLWYQSYVFDIGHRIGLDIASASYPRVLPNPNNGAPITETRPPVVARNSIHIGPEWQSQVLLPVADLKSVRQWGLPHKKVAKFLRKQAY